ncbi:MAG: response regulator [Proteobacteria bacterium]|nr:response regulator [Pseudomonadota bacterium]MBU4294867.1 response regulator [Pseudomonadota bacterium]MCG2749369.1 response regulator [Desulfobulbaceae bacterium]
MHALKSPLDQRAAEQHDPLRVLVIDDEENVAGLIAAILTSAGFVTETAFTCHDALAKAAASRFDIVIADILLPDGDGAVLINELKELCPDAAFVAMTGSNSKEMEQRVREQRVVYYLIKPFEYRELLEVFNHIQKRMKKEENKTRLSLNKNFFKGMSRFFIRWD